MNKTKFLIIKNINVNDASALNCYLSYGPPSVVQFAGCVHKLQRELNSIPDYADIRFKNFSFSLRDFFIMSVKKNGRKHFATDKHPGVIKSSRVENAPIIEQFRCAFTTNIVIEIENYSALNDEYDFAQNIKDILFSIRVGGGHVFNIGDISVIADNEKAEAKIKRALMPGFVLVDKTELAKEYDDKLDALVDTQKVIITFEEAKQKENTDDNVEEGVKSKSKAKTKAKPSKQDNSANKKIAQIEKKIKGFFVPQHLGYASIANTKEGTLVSKSYDYQHHFAEPLVGICEYKLPIKTKMHSLFWHTENINNESFVVINNRIN